MIRGLEVAITQEEFGGLVGLSQRAVSELMQRGVIQKDDTAQAWLHAYCAHIREQAAGRHADTDAGKELVQQRARLAKEHADHQAMKNAVQRGEYAPISVLANVLAVASSAVVDRFDHLEGMLAKACPEMPHEVMLVVQQVIASARNEWVRSTAECVDRSLDEMFGPDEEADADSALAEGAASDGE